MMASAFDGWVDRMDQRQIHGWACNPQDLSRKLSVTALVNGKPAGTAIADVARGDLAQQGVGDGQHGYIINVDQGAIRDGEAVNLQVVVEDGEQRQFLPFAPGLLPPSSPVPAQAIAQSVQYVAPPGIIPESFDPARKQLIWFDLTDLFWYLYHHRNVSGIQRVQCGYVANIAKHPNAASRYRFCIRPTEIQNGRYGELPHKAAADAIHLCATDTVMDSQAWHALIDKVRKTAFAEPAHMGFGDILYILGAPWVVPDYYLPIAQLKQNMGLRVIQLVYDVIPTVMPDVCGDGVIAVFNQALAGVIKNADAVFAISRYSADDFAAVVRKIERPVPPVGIVPMGGGMSYTERARGPSPSRQPPGRPVTTAVADLLTRPFVLCVGTIEPRKNHAYLFGIWRQLIRELGDKTPHLVCVGRPGWHMEDFFRQLRVTGNLDGKFRILSEISDIDLEALYLGCLFTVFPSTFEGWGLPVSESLSYGKLCVCADTTSLPEVGGDLAVYVDPTNGRQGYDVIRDLIAQPGKVRDIEKRIRDSYKPPSWAEATQALLSGIDTIEGLKSAVTPVRVATGEGGQVTTVRPPLAEAGRLYSFAIVRQAIDPYQRISEEFGILDAYDFLHGPAWHNPEGWGVWSSGADARLLLAVNAAELAEGLLAYAELSVPPHFGDRTCTVHVNGVEVMAARIESRPATFCFGLPQPPDAGWGSDGRVPLHVAFSIDGVIPRDTSGDSRELGIGITSLKICGLADVATRLDQIERHLFRMPRAGGTQPGAALARLNGADPHGPAAGPAAPSAVRPPRQSAAAKKQRKGSG